MSQHVAPASPDTDKRFAFGSNWRSFLDLVDEERIAQAEESLRDMLDVASLEGKRFLDVGSGSGLFSLAARRLGATVHSFDYDPESVACGLELRRRFFPDDEDWQIEQGSILDRDYVSSLDTFDVVYAWGVLHHTGAMWDALANVQEVVAPGGQLFLAIYNDQGLASRVWLGIKRSYTRGPSPLRWVLLVAIAAYFQLRSLVAWTLRALRHPGRVFERQERDRGMERWHDLRDWVGGYPFEVAKPEEIFQFFHGSGFQLTNLTTCGGGLGCNQFIFRRGSGPKGGD